MVGEASGDLHASFLMLNIKKQDINAQFFGVGGKKMEVMNFNSLVALDRLAVVGFWEVLKQLPFFIKLRSLVIQDIKDKKPDKIILVDYPGFNLRLAQAIKKNFDIPIIYYVSPQLWAWKEKRIDIIKKYVDSLVVLFPFEKKWYKERGVDVNYFGHPLSETYKSFLNSYKANKNQKPSIALLPGSRNSELKKHLPLYKKIIRLLLQKNKNLFFVLKFCDETNINIEKDLGLTANYAVETGESFAAFSNSDFAIVASGTATLEGAFTKTPMVVVYKTSWLSWFLAKHVFKIGFISIINILNKAKLVEEFVQKDGCPQKIATYVLKFLNSKEKIDYGPILHSLSQKNIYKNTAAHIISFDK